MTDQSTFRLVRGLVVFVLLVAALVGCADRVNENVRRLEATVVEDAGRYVLVADSSGERYAPEHMPRSYREHGLKVYVTGRAVALPPGSNADLSIALTSLALREVE